MKCPMCSGAGVIQGQAPGLVSCCPTCDGKGFIEQTNEEWLRGLSFNELARVLYCMIINGERIRPDLAYIKRWLKEIHNDN